MKAVKGRIWSDGKVLREARASIFQGKTGGCGMVCGSGQEILYEGNTV